jgi:hypothetical protein
MEKDFAEDLIKGRILETIFSLMFEEGKEFDVLPLGYEQTTPILAQYQSLLIVQQVLKNIRHAPDFALISHDHKKVFLVEVKYRKDPNHEYLIKNAEEINSRFFPCYLFVGSPGGFYFETCQDIIDAKGVKENMSTTWIGKELQEKYLNLQNKFINF